MVTFDGDTQEDRRLWHTYIYWARQRVKPDLDTSWTDGRVIIDNRQNRVRRSSGQCASSYTGFFVRLEYRLKACMNFVRRFPDHLKKQGSISKNFRNRLIKIDRFDRKGKCSPPAEWANCEKTLSSLVTSSVMISPMRTIKNSSAILRIPILKNLRLSITMQLLMLSN